MEPILGADEQAPFGIVNASGTSAHVLICEHASNRVPKALASLGLSSADLQRHIAWDIGAAATAQIMSRLLDAPLIVQNYSRLVYDCNRSLENESAIPALSEVFEVPGNRNLTPAARLARQQEIARPFHLAIADFLDARAAQGRKSILTSVHSFTPVYNGKPRTLDVGFLFDRDPSLANFLLKAFPTEKARLNEPYGPKDGVIYLMNKHAAPRGLKHVMIEIRNDLISEHTGQNAWANYLTVPLAQAAIKLASPATR